MARDPGGVPSDDEDPPVSAAREAFETNVFPILMASCAGCHTSAVHGASWFFPHDPAQAYDSIRQSFVVGDYTERAPIVRAHSGPMYTPAQRAAILAWLDLERRALGICDDPIVCRGDTAADF